MTDLLPESIGEQYYWRDLYRQPMPFWIPVLRTIQDCHQLEVQQWQRAPFGKNLVFFAGTVFVKLSPPFWTGDLLNEANAIALVSGHLRIETPDLLATGVFDGWGYIVMGHVAGVPLQSRWSLLSAEARHSLARQHGEMMAEIHEIPVGDAPAHLHWGWPPMTIDQLAQCEDRMRRSGVPHALLSDLNRYLTQADPLDQRWADRLGRRRHRSLDPGDDLVQHQPLAR